MELVKHINNLIEVSNRHSSLTGSRVYRKISERKIMSRRYIKNFFGNLPEDVIEFYTYLGNNIHCIFGEIDNEYAYHSVDFIYPLRNEHYSVEDNINTYICNERMPSWMFPFADSACGDQFVLSTRDIDYGTVYNWDHELEFDEDEGYTLDDYTENLTKVANSFSEFILSIKLTEEVATYTASDDEILLNKIMSNDFELKSKDRIRLENLLNSMFIEYNFVRVRAVDIFGGIFVSDRDDILWYFAPDTLEWESLDIYGDSIYKHFDRTVKREFYETYIGDDVIDIGVELNQLEGLLFYPFPFTEEFNSGNRSIQKLPLMKLIGMYLDYSVELRGM